jgi:hypothetical protein
MANQFSQFTRFKLVHVNGFDPPCSSRTWQCVQSVLRSVLNWFVRLGGLILTLNIHPFTVFPKIPFVPLERGQLTESQTLQRACVGNKKPCHKLNETCLCS